MSIRMIVLGLLIIALPHPVSAGDAIAMGYNFSGVWTAVTYNRSSTPKGGPHYHDSTQACAFALNDLRIRAKDDLVRTKIIGQSDRTGYVAIAHAKSTKVTPEGPIGVTAVGRGKTQAEADRNALQKLTNWSATEDQTIVYQYFSYGADSVARAHVSAKHRTKRTG